MTSRTVLVRQSARTVLTQVGTMRQTVLRVAPIVVNTGDGASLPIAQSDVVGLPAALSGLQEQLTETQTLAQTNQLNIGLKADQVDLDTTAQQVETNRLALLNKADLTALATLTALVGTKADQSYVNDQIAALVGTDGQVLAAIQAIADELTNAEGVLEALDQTVANRVRFDVATQALTALQKSNARTNIGAEEAGEAARLIALITAASIGAATATQGAKADTALQSVDVAPVALSGLFSSLAGQTGIFNVVFAGYTAGSNAVITAADSVGTMLRKLQGQITAIQSSVPTYLYSTVITTYRNVGLTSGNSLSVFNGNLVYAAGVLQLNDILHIDVWVKTSGSTTGTVQMRLAVNGGSYGVFWSQSLNADSTTRLMKVKATIVIDYLPNTSSTFGIVYITNDGSTRGTFTEQSFLLASTDQTQQLTLDFNITNAGGLTAGAEFAIVQATATVKRNT